MSQLTSLNVSGCDNLSSLSGVEGLSQLTSLAVSGCDNLSSLSGIEGLSQLTLVNVKNLSSIEGLSQLTSLDVSGCDNLSSLSGIKGLSQLTSLNVRWCSNLSSLSGIAGLSQLTSLNVFGCDNLSSLSGIEGLSQLTSLNVFGCDNLSSLPGIEGLSQLTSLNVDVCRNLSSLSGIEGLSQLTSLGVSGCRNLSSLSGIEGLSQLTSLNVRGCDNLSSLSWEVGEHIITQFPRLSILGRLPIEHVPVELTEDFNQRAVEDWYHDLQTSGYESPEALKVMLLGNGRIGKTQLARRLRGDSFDVSVPSTHGIQINQFTHKSGAQIHTWDFGGQDVYLSTHTMFIDKQAIYLLLWHPEAENTDLICCDQLTIRNKPLSYWLAYLNSLVGEQANVMVCQSQCDSPAQELPEPIPHPTPLKRLKRVACSAKAEDGLELFHAQFDRAVKYQLAVNGEIWLPKTWLKVRQLLQNHYDDGEKRMCFEQFEALCQASHVSAPYTLAKYLHQSGCVFFRQGHFNNDLILDQAWALQGVYLLLERDIALPQLRENQGKFSQETLRRLLWDNPENAGDEALFIKMMQQCGVCFEMEENQYIAPDALPDKASISAQLIQIWQSAVPDIEIRLDYLFLHEATQRVILSRMGSIAKAAACYWRYGCCYFDSKHQVKVMLECFEIAESELTQEHIDSFSRPGHIRIHIAGAKGGDLAEHLVDSINDIQALGAKPQVQWLKGAPKQEESMASRSSKEPFSEMGEAIQPPVPKVFFSYAWGAESDERQQRCDEIYQYIEQQAWLDVYRDKESMSIGDSIDEFERQIGRGDFIVLLISEKSLHSAHCMKEMGHIYQRCQRQKEEFVGRVIPVVLSDAKIDSLKDRLSIASYWKKECTELNAQVEDLGAAIAGAESIKELEIMRSFLDSCVNTLKWVSDLVTERHPDLQVDATVELILKRIREA